VIVPCATTQHPGLAAHETRIMGRVNINTGVQIDAEALSSRLIPRLEYRWDPAQ
jgi:hypothetical protein